MTPERQLLHSIDRAAADAEVKLRGSWESERRVALIQLVRTMDLVGVASRPESDSALRLEWLYLNGYPRALRIFLDESTFKPGFPLLPGDLAQQRWAAAALQQAGRIELFRRVLSWCRQGLANLRARKDGALEVLVASGAGVEAIEREDYVWLANLAGRIHEPAMQGLLERQAHIDDLMSPRVYPWRRHFIGYTTTREIDAHFQALGVLYSHHLVGQDSFPGEASFGGVPFDVYRATVATLVGWSMKHVRFCSLLKRKNPETDLANVLTLAVRGDDLIRDVADALDLEPEVASTAIDVLVLGEGNVHPHYAASSGAAPPLLAIGREFLLHSAHGWHSEPYMFMLAGLCRAYRGDWDRAVGLREGMFRSELYELFKWSDVVMLSSGCKLRGEGRLLTDIDAVILHRPTKTVGLFQLKWQDAFGASMQLRASRQANLQSETGRWLDNVSAWLSGKSDNEKARGLGLDRFGVHAVTDVEMFVLSRQFAHFSGSIADARAAWGLWPQVLRLFENAIDHHRDGATDRRRLPAEMVSNPIRWLAESLRMDSPASRLPTLRIANEVADLGGLRLVLRFA
jgi:hypothetical protein